MQEEQQQQQKPEPESEIIYTDLGEPRRVLSFPTQDSFIKAYYNLIQVGEIVLDEGRDGVKTWVITEKQIDSLRYGDVKRSLIKLPPVVRFIRSCDIKLSLSLPENYGLDILDMLDNKIYLSLGKHSLIKPATPDRTQLNDEV